MAQSYPIFALITLDTPFAMAAASQAECAADHTEVEGTPAPHESIAASMPSMPSMREAPTQPVVEGDSRSDADSEPASGVFATNPEWCIDLGDEMIALHAVELYARLATGQIPAEAPVWRVGREAWTPAKDVPELRYAVEDGTPSTHEVAERERYDGDRPSMDVALKLAQAG